MCWLFVFVGVRFVVDVCGLFVMYCVVLCGVCVCVCVLIVFVCGCVCVTCLIYMCVRRL